MNKLRVLLVDANVDFLHGVSAWLLDETEIQVVGTADSGLGALEQVERLQPDLVLTAGTMPEMDGFETTRRIKAQASAPLVVLTTFHDSKSTRDEASSAGADGFIAKSSITEDLLGLVRKLVEESRDEAQSKLNNLPNSGPSTDL